MADFVRENFTSSSETNKDAIVTEDGIILKSWEVAGTGDVDNHEVIRNNLKIVSLICNIFTIGMSLFLIYKLSAYLDRSKSNA